MATSRKPSVAANGQTFDQVWTAAREAAQDAAATENARLGEENCRGFDCGFAWVTIPGTDPFGRWLKNAGIASKGYPTGLQIWYSKLHSVPTQSISVHEAAARAARDVIAHATQSREVSMGSRLD